MKWKFLRITECHSERRMPFISCQRAIPLSALRDYLVFTLYVGTFGENAHLKCTSNSSANWSASSVTDRRNGRRLFPICSVQFKYNISSFQRIRRQQMVWPFSAFKFKLNTTYLVFVTVYVLVGTTMWSRCDQKWNSYCYRLISHFSFS